MSEDLEQRPLVTIVLPSYNHKRWVSDAVHSVLAQTYSPIQLVVVDDASTDGSQNLLERLSENLGFELILNTVNLGLNGSLDKAVARAKGLFVGILASDDLMEPDKVRRQVQFLLNTGLDAVYAGGWVLLPSGRRELLDSRRIAAEFAQGTALRFLYTRDTAGPYTQSALFTAAAMKGLASVRAQFKSDDWALTIRLLESCRVGFLDEPLFTYRLHDANSHAKYWRTFPMRVEVVCTLTPESLRTEALANLLESQATYLARDGRASLSMRYVLGAWMLDSRRRRIGLAAKLALRPAAKRLGRTSNDS